MNMIDVRVAAIEQVTPLIKHFKFVKEDGAKLPPFSGGSHIVVALDAEGETYRNPYSLMGSPTETDAYHISVSRKENSKGGSAYMHENISVGMSLKITPPVNFFTLAKTAHKHILIAGGIGIAPFISQIEDLNRIGAEYEMHYAFRSYQQAAFVDDLQKSCGNKLHCYSDSEDIPLDLNTLLGSQSLGTHVYVCGPSPMVIAVLETAKKLGWPDSNVHHEQPLSPPASEPLKVQLAKPKFKGGENLAIGT